MSDQENQLSADESTAVPGDVEGHRAVLGQTEDEDVEGHRVALGQTEDEDVEGHRAAAMQPPRGDDDVEGHRFAL